MSKHRLRNNSKLDLVNGRFKLCLTMFSWSAILKWRDLCATNSSRQCSDTENDEVDPWDKLREEVINVVSSAWEEQVQENLRQGLQEDDAEIQASNRLLPVYRKKLRHLYLQYLRWYHDLKTDPVHKKVMKTLRSFMEDDEMDYTETVEATIS